MQKTGVEVLTAYEASFGLWHALRTLATLRAQPTRNFAQRSVHAREVMG
jgi:hypothetical protein